MTLSAPAGGGAAFTVRAVTTGLLLALAFAALAPFNDWQLKNTYLYSQHLPIGVMVLVVMTGMVFNPLLGRRRYRSGEMLVVTGLLLVIGGVVSSGLNRTWTGVVAGPARVFATTSELDPLSDDEGLHLPSGLYLGVPDHGAPARESPEHRYLIDGFHEGLAAGDPAVVHGAEITWRDQHGVVRQMRAWQGSGGGADDLHLDTDPGSEFSGHHVGDRLSVAGSAVEILAISTPAVPWSQWIAVLARWTPLLLGAMVAFLAIAALVRDQWLHHERLPYPIATTIATLLADPEPGRRIASIYANSGFRLGAAVVGAVLLFNGTNTLGLHPFSFPTEIQLSGVLDLAPLNHAWAFWGLATPKIFFGIIAITFLLSSDVSFSLWFWFVVVNVVYAVLDAHGVPLRWSDPSQMVAGAWFVECGLILWTGRRYYGRVLRAAVMPTADPGLRTVRVFAWGLLAGVAAMVGAMVAWGAHLHHACLAALVFLGMGLVLARLVAEAGIPFVQAAIGWQGTSIIFSFTGFAFPATALVPLTLLGQTLCADPREHLLPFAVNAEYLAEKAGAPRLRWAAFALLTVALAACVAAGVMLVCAYHGDGMVSLDGYWRSALMNQGLGPVVRAAGGGGDENAGVMWRYGLGAAIMAGLGAARLAWSWWPLHPVGFLVCASYPTIVVWFSFLMGWLAKVLVMRYGGLRLYRRLQPVAIGMIAGEALVAGGFLVLSLVCAVLGVHLAGRPHILPG